MEQSQQKYLVIGLAVVVIVLVGVIGYLVINSQNQQVAEPAAAPITGAPAQTPPAGMGQAPAGMGQGATGGTGAAPADFDPAKATAVPKDSTPEAFVKDYYEAILKKDYASAFKLLPADKQAGSSADALKQQIEGYGVTAYTVTQAAEQDGKFIVNADQVTQSYGTFSNAWVFVKNGDVWVLQSKAVTGMK